ncbi:unnamed protein product [Didymodactylos carnosus]|uniref:Uncharacterized protein n=1 Tax=Didymodactylos carnosus TaxID=1234261 RepID=A0A815YTR0_9BILA|nr:unnamed protein product [Didymodactylos carnosus]CAF1575069.1 unnamed protein product [Didymodactylos carnosus]CAF4264998.1 unnamed protein product [Didymodactylos carnosus]CAF4439844.1 unnamed protein product [Didymodactylos carnosus]
MALQRQSYPWYHQSIACNLRFLGEVYHGYGEKKLALKNCSEALVCYKYTLADSNHPIIQQMDSETAKLSKKKPREKFLKSNSTTTSTTITTITQKNNVSQECVAVECVASGVENMCRTSKRRNLIGAVARHCRRLSLR